MNLEDILTSPPPRRPWFYIDIHFYLLQCVRKGVAVESDDPEDVRAHFLLNHKRYCLSPNPFFDEDYYRKTYPTVSDRIRLGLLESGFDHFIRAGSYENHNPIWYFDANWYQRQYGDLTKEALLFSGQIDLYSHFLDDGLSERRDGSWLTWAARKIRGPVASSPCSSADLIKMMNSPKLLCDWVEPMLDLNWLQIKHPPLPDVSAAVRTYFMVARSEAWSPGPAFDERAYRDNYPDVAEAVSNGTYVSGYHHYICYGMFEDHRRPFDSFISNYYFAHNRNAEDECQRMNLTPYLHFLKFRRARSLRTCPAFSELEIPESFGKGIFEPPSEAETKQIAA